MRSMRDPAPSRLAYRLNRWLLTPGFRLFLRAGLPFLGFLALGLFWASDEARVQDAFERLSELRREIEERPEFMVHMMAVDNASPGVAREVREVLSLDFPISSFDLDPDILRAELEKLDVIASVSVRIRSGGVLDVDVVERQPAVLWRNGESLVMLDLTGHVVASVDQRSDRSDLPLIVGEGAEAAVVEALELISVAEIIGPRLRGLQRVGARRWDLVMDREQRIMLPEADATKALRKVIALDAAQDLLARDIAAIDFRNPRRPVVRLTSAAIETLYDTDWSPGLDD